MASSPPDVADWGDFAADLDVAYAYRQFGGKSAAQALHLFAHSDLLSRVEDLAAMPPLPFRFYMPVFRDFVVSPEILVIHDGLDACIAADAYLNLISDKLHDDPQAIVPILAELLPAAEYVAAHQGLYKADEEIYGSFDDTLAAIHEAARRLSGESAEALPPVDYLHLAPGAALPALALPQPFRTVVIVDAKVPAAWQIAACEWLVRSGCLRVMAWGIDCSSWALAADWANLEQFNLGDIPAERRVLTSSHAKEPLSEVLWHSKHTAAHPQAVLQHTLLLHVGLQGDEPAMLQAFADA